MHRFNALVFAAAAVVLLDASCSSSPASDDTPSGAVGGSIVGEPDAHCQGITAVVVDPASCTVPEAQGSEGGASGGQGDAGAGGSDCNQTHDAEYGDTLPSSEGDDDDCKFHVNWTSTPIRANQDVTFTVAATALTDAQPVQALSDGKVPLSRIEAYQPCNPTRRGPAQNSRASFHESAPGVFEGGPIRFDQPGRWVVRFHLYEQCLDGESSPHGHVAFFIDVP